MRRRILAFWILLCSAGLAVAAPAALTVYAAASLADVLQVIADRYTAQTGVAVRVSFAASSVLARQIEAGAAADVFLSADSDWMDYLAQRHLVDDRSRRDLLTNRLVLIAPANGTRELTIGPGFPLAAALGDDRLAVADPDSVPAGRYARAALVSLHVWDSVSAHLARAENVRAALQYVARGESPLGIVYETDARADPRVRVVGVFPAGSHPPIRYPVALTAGAVPGARAFLDALVTPESRAVFAGHGFGQP